MSESFGGLGRDPLPACPVRPTRDTREMDSERQDYDEHLPPPWWFRLLRPSDYLVIVVVPILLLLSGVAAMWALGR